MLLVKTKIRKSALHGVGIFADQFIPKGMPTWRYMPGLDLALTEAELEALPDIAKLAFKNYCYKSKRTGRYILCFDDARYFNHADDANCITDERYDAEEYQDISARDIQPGEELTNNYREFDADFDYKMSHDIRV